jgi:copper chaperone
MPMKVVLNIENMTCSGCQKNVTKAIRAADPAAIVDVDLDVRQVETRTKTEPAKLVELLANAGYKAQIIALQPR